MPNDPIVLEAVALARRLNPAVRIFARCEYVSTGMKAERKGADEVVVAEKVIATEFGRLVEQSVLPVARQPPPAKRQPRKYPLELQNRATPALDRRKR